MRSKEYYICGAIVALALGVVQSLEASPPAGKEAEPGEIIETYTRAVGDMDASLNSTHVVFETMAKRSRAIRAQGGAGTAKSNPQSTSIPTQARSRRECFLLGPRSKILTVEFPPRAVTAKAPSAKPSGPELARFIIDNGTDSFAGMVEPSGGYKVLTGSNSSEDLPYSAKADALAFARPQLSVDVFFMPNLLKDRGFSYRFNGRSKDGKVEFMFNYKNRKGIELKGSWVVDPANGWVVERYATLQTRNETAKSGVSFTFERSSEGRVSYSKGARPFPSGMVRTDKTSMTASNDPGNISESSEVLNVKYSKYETVPVDPAVFRIADTDISGLRPRTKPNNEGNNASYISY
jgi:hypothetical protein